MLDWGAGSYERTAAELEPVSSRVVQELAGPLGGAAVLDVACGTGNAALLAAAAGARVAAVDAAPRLLEVARRRAKDASLNVDFRLGDMLALPVADHDADLVVSVFGVIFAPDPARALAEIARVLRPGGRALISAWVPAGPLDAMLGALGRVLQRATGQPPPSRFAWSDPQPVGRLARGAGLELTATHELRLAIRAASPEEYVVAGREHPMAVANRPALEAAGAGEEAEAAMLAALREGNEDPAGFLIHTPYVVHELRLPRDG